jgi:hypothetical protein
MPITSENTTVNEDGQEKNGLTFTFTNGAKEQLEELKKFFKSPTELDVIKLGISVLQNFKEKEEVSKEKEENENAPDK